MVNLDSSSESEGIPLYNPRDLLTDSPSSLVRPVSALDLGDHDSPHGEEQIEVGSGDSGPKYLGDKGLRGGSGYKGGKGDRG